jgi:hypothetical protein
LEQAYQLFAATLMSVCPPNFQEAKLVASLEDAVSDIRYDCNVDGQLKKGLPYDGQNDWDIHKALHALRKEMTIPGEVPWSRCTFTLFPDGKFKFDVEYDD